MELRIVKGSDVQIHVQGTASIYEHFRLTGLPSLLIIGEIRFQQKNHM